MKLKSPQRLASFQVFQKICFHSRQASSAKLSFFRPVLQVHWHYIQPIIKIILNIMGDPQASPTNNITKVYKSIKKNIFTAQKRLLIISSRILIKNLKVTSQCNGVVQNTSKPAEDKQRKKKFINLTLHPLCLNISSFSQHKCSIPMLQYHKSQSFGDNCYTFKLHMLNELRLLNTYICNYQGLYRAQVYIAIVQRQNLI